MGFVEAVKSGFAKTFTIKGRAVRSEYWFFTLFAVILSTIAQVVVGVLASAMPSLGVIITLPLLAVVIVIFVPSLTVSIRRLHDTDRSGWWFLVNFVPLIGALVFLYFMIIKGTEGDNRFGPDMLGGDKGTTEGTSAEASA